MCLHVFEHSAVRRERFFVDSKCQFFTGKDATTAFQDVGHSSDAIELRKKYLIGRLSEEARRPVLVSVIQCWIVLPTTGVTLHALLSLFLSLVKSEKELLHTKVGIN